MQPLLSIVVAVAENGGIGKDNQLLWHLPDDLKHFKRLTLGHPVLMGRKTYASIGRPLPGRRNLVLTRDTAFRAEGVEVVHSVEEALQKAGGQRVFVIGGAEVYALLLPLADEMYLTQVQASPAADTFFPAFDKGRWQELSRLHHPADERHAFAFDMVQLMKKA